MNLETNALETAEAKSYAENTDSEKKIYLNPQWSA